MQERYPSSTVTTIFLFRRGIREGTMPLDRALSLCPRQAWASRHWIPPSTSISRRLSYWHDPPGEPSLFQDCLKSLCPRQSQNQNGYRSVSILILLNVRMASTIGQEDVSCQKLGLQGSGYTCHSQKRSKPLWARFMLRSEQQEPLCSHDTIQSIKSVSKFMMGRGVINGANGAQH
jgi:hypothetical protein